MLNRTTAGAPPGPQPHEIRLFYELGIRGLARRKADRCSASAAAEALASEEGVSADRARKAARFADHFDGRSLRWLCALEYRPGVPLSVDHVRRVITAGDPATWRRWFERAAAEGLTTGQLERLIRQARGDKKKRGGGPKIRPAGDLCDALAWTEEWLKR